MKKQLENSFIFLVSFIIKKFHLQITLYLTFRDPVEDSEARAEVVASTERKVDDTFTSELEPR